MLLKNMLSKLSPFYLLINYVIKEICLYVILASKKYVILSGRGTSLYP